MASPGVDTRARARRRREDEVAEAAAAVKSARLSVEKTTSTRGADPRARASRKRKASSGSRPSDPRARSRKRHEEVAAAAAATVATGGDLYDKTRVSRCADHRASGKRRGDEDVAVVTVDDPRRSVTRRLNEQVGAVEPEELSMLPPPSSEIVRAQDLLALPEGVTTHILRSLPRQLSIWEIDHQPASFCFHLQDGMFPSPDELTELLNMPDLVHIRRFSLVVHTDEVTNLQMGGYLTRASQCRTEELTLEYHEAVDNNFIFHLAGFGTSLMKLFLNNVTMSLESLAISPVFSALSVMQLCSVRITDSILSQIITLCPSISTLTLEHIGYLNEIVFTAPVIMLRSLTIVNCCNITLLDLEELCGLKTFFYHGPLAKMHFNADACIQDMLLCSEEKEFPEDPGFHWIESPPNFSMLNVLALSSNYLSVLASCIVRNINLDALEELQVTFVSLDCRARCQLISFLHVARCTKLRRLVLQLGEDSSHLDMEEEEPREDLELSLRNLDLIRAEEFSGNSNQMSLLSTLLLKVTRVKKLVLSSSDDHEGLQQKVSFLKECSKTTKVILMEGNTSLYQPVHFTPTEFSCKTGAGKLFLGAPDVQMVGADNAGDVMTRRTSTAALATSPTKPAQGNKPRPSPGRPQRLRLPSTLLDLQCGTVNSPDPKEDGDE